MTCLPASVVNLVWEIERRRRLEAPVVRARMLVGVEKVMPPLLGIVGARERAEQWRAPCGQGR